MWTTLKFRADPNLRKYKRTVQLKFQAYDIKRVLLAAQRARLTLELMLIPHTGPAVLPVKISRYSFLRNPFKWKKHQELWEIRHCSAVVKFETDHLTARKAIDVLRKTIYGGVGMRIRTLTFEPLEKYYKNPYLHTAEINYGNQLEKLRKSKEAKKNISRSLFPIKPAKGKILESIDGKLVATPIVEPHDDFTEPDVIDQDIVYDDSDFLFEDTTTHIDPLIENVSIERHAKEAVTIMEELRAKHQLSIRGQEALTKLFGDTLLAIPQPHKVNLI